MERSERRQGAAGHASPHAGAGDALRRLAAERPDDPACTFLEDGEDRQKRVTYGELGAQAHAVAARLLADGCRGERALLLYPDGLEFVAGLFGCFFAGAVAVPTFPPHPARLARTVPRLQGVVADCGPRFLLTTRAALAFRPRILEHAPELDALAWIATDALEDPGPDGVALPPAEPDGLAYLQYTSGSTGRPKGTRVTHANLLHNETALAGSFDHGPHGRVVTWLPVHHDMGLIGNLLQAIHVGCPCVMMSPLAFLQRPFRWLRAISRHRATVSGGPNFAYDLCVRKVRDEELPELDLSSWELAFNGAEPIRHATLESFARRFAPCGFRREAFYPCYGLAEATLVVSGGPKLSGPRCVEVAADALEERRVAPPAPGTAGRRLVGAGRVLGGQEVVIVDPDTRERLPADRVGEIWIAGPSVADGYWGRPEATRETFGARPAGGGSRPYLRTGDLGFLRDGDLHVAGRLKDLVIVRGRNHHPHDIEATVQAGDARLRPGCGAAFTVEGDEGEALVLVQEADLADGADPEPVLAGIRRAVAEAHGLRLHAVTLIAPRSLPKTTSGKVQRRATREAWLRGELETRAAWREPAAEADAARPRRARRDADALEAWLVDRVAEAAGLDAHAIDPDEPLAAHGLDSAQTVALTAQLEDRVGRALEPTLAWEHPSLRALAAHLAGARRDAPPPGAAASRDEPVAVVGIGCRVPGARGPDAFWRLLADGVDAVGEMPEARRDAEALAVGADDPRLLRGGFLDAVDGFDAAFFGIPAGEAAAMDPQQRLLLEVTHEALEDAGCSRRALAGTRTGVFVGITGSEYAGLQIEGGAPPGPFFATGAAPAIAANRISYHLGVRGPSLAVDTACSSSLLAVHLACQSLRAGESATALAGGVNLVLRPGVTTRAMAETGALAADGRCKAFDASADGYVRGEGCAVVVLKPLARARADGDRIYALVRGSAANNDGASNGLMAPSPVAQEEVLRAAWQAAGVEAASLQYVEAHGTGTRLGDPIEARALGRARSEGGAPGRPLAIGSVKTNIGHLEAAAGVAGLVKVALSLRARTLPPSLHLAEPSPLIPFAALGLRVPCRAEPWPDGEGPARAGVSAFGFGGSNVHVVLEAAPEPAAEAAAGAPDAQLVPLSARTPETLAELARRWRERLAHDPPPLADVAFTAAVRRDHHAQRRAWVVDSVPALCDALAEAGSAAQEASPARLRARRPRLAFVFSGQGSDWAGMGRELFAREPVFRDALAACDAAIARETGWSLLEELARDAGDARLDEAGVVQPAVFALQVAIARQLEAWGLAPDAVVGHSLGEVAAAHVAGALDLDDAARVVCCRSRLVGAASPPGAMGMVELPAGEARELAARREGVGFAGSNGPSSSLLSGEAAAVDAVLAELDGRGVFARRVHIGYASHSPLMDPLLAPLRRALAGLAPRGTAGVTFHSTVTAAPLDGARLDADYWARNLREPIRFGETLAGLAGEPGIHFVEVSPHPVLLPALREGLRALGHEAPVVLPTLERGRPERVALLGTAAGLYAAGHDPAWDRLQEGGGRFVPLPGHPLRPERFWVGPSRRAARGGRRSVSVDGRRAPAHPLLAEATRLGTGGRCWETSLDLERFAPLADHRVAGVAVLPAAAWVELARAAAEETFGTAAVCVEALSCERPCVLPEPGTRRVVQTVLEPGDEAGARVVFFASEGDPDTGETGWSRCATARVRPQAPGPEEAPAEPAELAERLSPADHYAWLEAAGLEYGEAFRGLASLSRDGRAVAARIVAPEPVARESARYGLHPAVLDAAFQALGAAWLDPAGDAAPDAWLPTGLERFRLYARPDGALRCRAELREPAAPDAATCSADLALFAEDGTCVARLEGLSLQRVAREALAETVRDPLEGCLHEVRWEPQEAAAAHERARAEGAWLVLGDGSALCGALCAALRAAGERCMQADPDDPADAGERLRALTVTPSGCRGVVQLLSDEDDASPAAAAERHAVRVLRLVQVLARSGARAAPRLWLVTRGAQEAGSGAAPEDGLSPAGAAVWGLANVVRTEHAELRCAQVDLDPGGGPEEAAALASELLADGDEDRVALRAGARHVARLVRASAPPRAAEAPRLAGTQLVTGGFGGLGLALARWLASRGARHLALLGRRDPPPEARAAIRELEGEGVRVLPLVADVRRGDALAAALGEIDAALPPLRGVFHLAGVLDDALLLDQKESAFRAVLAPKLTGAWNLHALTRERPLDHFVLYGSASALLGPPGQGAYAAGNAFLDALARRRRGAGLAGLAIQWGAFGEVGMAARRLADGGRLGIAGTPLLTPAQGDAALDRLATQGRRTGVAVIPLDARRWMEVFPQTARLPFLAALRDGGARLPAPGALRARLVAAEPRRRRALLEEALLARLAEALQLDPGDVSPRAPVVDLGLTSLLALELKSRLEVDLGLVLGAQLFFVHPDVASLAGHVLELLGLEADGAPDALDRLSLDELASRVEAALGEEDARA